MNPKDLRQWVCWRSEKRDGKSTKVPYSPTTGVRARCDDPTTWVTFTEARDATRTRDYYGIGFVFTQRDPFCGVDLDGCLDPETGEVEAWASEIVEELTSYTEISPSGTGLHVIVRAVLPGGGNRKGRIELYDRGRFFTVTGRRLPGSTRAVEDRQDRIQALHTRLFPQQEQEPSAGKAGRSGLPDEEVLRRAMSAANGDKFARLWSGDRSGYASDSEADLALCPMLAFWAGPDEERIASLVSSSGLSRQKWNREDYRRRTVRKALANTTEFYLPALQDSGDAGDPTRADTTPRASLPEAIEFPVAAMPEPCRRLAEEGTASLGCAPELVALPSVPAHRSPSGALCLPAFLSGAPDPVPRCPLPGRRCAWRACPASYVSSTLAPSVRPLPSTYPPRHGARW